MLIHIRISIGVHKVSLLESVASLVVEGYLVREGVAKDTKRNVEDVHAEG